MKPESDIIERARRIKLLLMDCDGVLTDGRLWLTADGDEQKVFHVRDGQGLVLIQQAGIRTGIISGRTSVATERRARELGISFLRQGVADKIRVFEEVLSEAGVLPDECGYIGDDVGDVGIMNRAGLSIAVADAAAAARQVAHFVTSAAGGQGAVREACELILSAHQHSE